LEVTTLLLFLAIAFPLICTPGPDILLIASQSLSFGRQGAYRAVAGVLLGYIAHAVLSAIGVAALVATKPWLYELLRWLGIAYLVYLASQMLRSAFTVGQGVYAEHSRPVSLRRGFLTSFLNPKGLLSYLAVLPQFINPEGNVALQAVVLSGVFILCCALVYGGIGLVAASASTRGVNDRSRRRVEGGSAILLAGAAAKIATQ